MGSKSSGMQLISIRVVIGISFIIIVNIYLESWSGSTTSCSLIIQCFDTPGIRALLCTPLLDGHLTNGFGQQWHAWSSGEDDSDADQGRFYIVLNFGLRIS
jgi:hypothetical protein